VPSRLRWPRRSLNDIAVLALPLLVLIVISHTSADPDLWGHLRFGSDLLQTHRLHLRDIYSFTSDVVWINHEWLSEALFAGVFMAFGAIGLNLLKLSVIGVVALIAWRTARKAGASPSLALAVTSLLVFTTYTRTQALRPQLLSVALFALMVFLLEHQEGQVRWLGLSVLFAVWANSHGGWIVGYAALCAWVVGRAFEERSPRAVVVGCGLAGSAALATLLNPYNFGLWNFLQTTVGLSRSDISDWTPLVKLPTAVIAIDLVFPVIALMSTVALRQKPSARHITVVAMLSFGTWRVGRVDAFLQVATALLFMPVIVNALRSVTERYAGWEPMSRTSALNGMAAAALAATLLVVSAKRVSHIIVEGPWIPDREAVRFLRTGPSPTRLMTWFDWGEYAIWHLSPGGVQVSMDGRRETVYSAEVLADHWAFYRNEPDAWRYADRIGADRIWLPREMPVVSSLRQHGWHVAFESDRSIVLSRESGRPLVASRDRSPQFFPAE
jgi:hypothetical protein